MKSMRPPLAAIFYDLFLQGRGGGHSPLSPLDLLLGVSVRWVSATDTPQPRYGGRAGGTHPTEMHSFLWMYFCLYGNFVISLLVILKQVPGKLFIVTESFDIPVNDFDAKKSARYSRVFVVSELCNIVFDSLGVKNLHITAGCSS